MLIDCDTCRVRDLACGDCVVTVLLGSARVDLDGEEQAAIAVLASSGLVPPLRLVAGADARSDSEPAVHRSANVKGA
jgi:hypothetical protein